MSEPLNKELLKVQSLRVSFQSENGPLTAVNDLSFALERGATLGIAGESGSGKSVASLAIMRLLDGQVEAEAIEFDGQELLKLSERAMQKIRGRRIAMIFQDPGSSLNPYLKIGDQLTEMTRWHLKLTKTEARRQAVELLKRVGLADAEARFDDYPHQFSGGMKQRVMIAMALSCQPELIIADEPTTALDVTIQAQVLDLLRQLKAQSGTSLILISHDLGVLAGMTDEILVMYAGSMMEWASTEKLFEQPQNPYTKALLKSLPDASSEQAELFHITGLPPDLTNLPPGCAFAPRCPEAFDKCQEPPPIFQISENHLSRCWRHKV